MPVEAHVRARGQMTPQSLQVERGFNKNQDPSVAVDFGAVAANANFEHTPAYFLHIFNIAPREFVREKPPLYPRLVLAACPVGEPYIEVARIPDIVVEPFLDANSGETRTNRHRGETIAQDIVCPNGAATSWVDGGTDDMSKRGLFWTRNETPTPEELQTARGKMEAFYRQQIDFARKLAQEQKAGEITPEMHTAGEYFRVQESWHLGVQVPSICENCGEQIKAGIPFHVVAGIICVRDWKKAVEAGAKQRSDVPPEKRWWGKNAQGGEATAEE